MLRYAYGSECDKIAFDTLSEKALRSKADACSALKCSLETFEKWMRDNQSFHDAVVSGLLEGEKKFRKKINRMAFRSPKTANTKLLLALAQDVYGIGDPLSDKHDPFKSPEDADKINDQDAIDIYYEVMKGEK